MKMNDLGRCLCRCILLKRGWEGDWMPSAYPLPLIPNNPLFFFFFLLSYSLGGKGGGSVIVSLVRVANIRDDGIIIKSSNHRIIES